MKGTRPMAMRSVELRGVESFASLSRPELAAVAGAARLTVFTRGTSLFAAGDPCESIGWVSHGFVRLYGAAGGAEVTTGIVQAGGLLTIAPLLNQPVHVCYAEALGTVQVIELPVPLVQTMSARSSVFANSLMICLRHRGDGAYGSAAISARAPLAERVLHVLRLVAASPVGDAPGLEMCRLAVRLSHEQLARMVGSERTTISHALRTLEQQGEVQRAHGHVTHVRKVSRVRMASA